MMSSRHHWKLDHPNGQSGGGKTAILSPVFHLSKRVPGNECPHTSGLPYSVFRSQSFHRLFSSDLCTRATAAPALRAQWRLCLRLALSRESRRQDRGRTLGSGDPDCRDHGCGRHCESVTREWALGRAGRADTRRLLN